MGKCPGERAKDGNARQVGEFIPLPFYLQLRLLTLRDFRVGPEHVTRCAVRAARKPAADEEPADAPILVEHPMFEFVRGGYPSEMHLSRRRRGTQIFGMQSLHPIVEMV